MIVFSKYNADTVRCRTGSLEISFAQFLPPYPVHCRTGSLENIFGKGQEIWAMEVHCRTGGLESDTTTSPYWNQLEEFTAAQAA